MFIPSHGRKADHETLCPPVAERDGQWWVLSVAGAGMASFRNAVSLIVFAMMILLVQADVRAEGKAPLFFDRTGNIGFDCPVDPGTIGNDQIICSGTVPAPITSIVNASEPGTITGSIYYSWETTHDGGVTWNSLPGQHGSGYSPGALSSETWYRRKAYIVDGAINALCPGQYSNVVKIKMVANAVGGVVTADQQICGGLQPADLTLAGNSASVLKWQRSEDVAFLTPTDINVTSTKLTGAAIGTLTNTTWFRAVINNGTCPQVYSGSVTIPIQEDFTNWVSPPANPTYGGLSHFGSFSNVNGQLILDGYGGYSLTQVSKGSVLEFTANFDANSIYTNVGMSGTQDFDAPFVAVGRGLGNTAGHVYARINTGSGPKDLDLGALAGQLHTYKIVWGSSSFAFYVDGIYVLTLPGTINGPLYQNFYDYLQDFNSLVIDQIKVTSTRNTEIIVDTPSTGGILTADQVICSGTTPADITLSGSVGRVIKWQSAADAAFTSPVDIAVTDTFLTAANMGTLSGSTWFRAVVQKGTCPTAYSTSTRVTVDAPTAGGKASADQTACSGTTPADIQLAGETGNILKWQSSPDNTFATPTDIAVTSNTLAGASIGALTADRWVRAVVQHGVCAVAYSTVVHLAMSPVSVGGTASGDQAFCAGSPATDLTLSGQTGNVLRWQRSSDAAFTSPVDIANTTTTLTSAEIGTLGADAWFRAEVQSGSCGSAWSTVVHITVTPVNAGAVSPDGHVCPGANTGSVNLSGQAGAVQKWQSSTDGGLNWTDIAMTATTYSFSNLTLTTQFRAAVQNGACPVVYSGVSTISMNPTPLLVTVDQMATGIPQTADLTSGAVTLGSDPVLNFSYWNDAAASNALATPSAATPGDYFIKGTNGSGCSGIKPVKVIASPMPTLVIIDPLPVCAPTTVDITASSVTTGSTSGLIFTYWQDAAATIAYATPSTATNGTYYIMGKDGNGNQVVKPVRVTVNQPSQSTTSMSICDKNAPYNWNGHAYSVSGSYSVTLTNAAGCDSVATLNLTVNAATSSLTPVTIADTQLPYSWNGNLYSAAGSFSITLAGATHCDSVATLVLTVLPPATSSTDAAICAGSFPYRWNGNPYAAPGTYSVKLTATDGRDSIATLNLTSLPQPALAVSGPGPICEGIMAELVLRMQGTAPFTVTYDDGTGIKTESGIGNAVHAFSVDPSSTTTYRFLSVEDAHCRNDAVNADVTVNVIPAQSGVRLPTVNAIANVPRRLQARNLGGDYQYAWSPGNGLSSTSLVEPMFNGSFDQEYHILMHNNTGCGTTDTLLVRVTDMNTPGHDPDIIVPTAFTPNGDGKNDLLTPIPINLDHLVTFRIFNRWGNVVFESTTSNKGWDGTYKNLTAPTESFTWTAEGVDRNGKTIHKHGMVTLIR